MPAKKNAFIKDSPRFLILWSGQTLSVIGSVISAYAIGIWIYETTGSFTLYALNMVGNILPAVLLGPLAAVTAERWPRRVLMFVTDFMAAVTTAGILVMLYVGFYPLWAVILAGIFNQAFTTFQMPAYHDVVEVLVKDEHEETADGMIAFSNSLARLFSPALAGFIYVVLGFERALIIDLITFGIAMISLLIVRIPKPERLPWVQHEEEWVESTLKSSWLTVRAVPALRSLLAYTAADTFLVNAILLVIPPMLISLHGPLTAGFITGLLAAGMLVGGYLLTRYGNPKRRLNAYFGLAGLSLLLLLPFGIFQNPYLLGLAAFFIMMPVPLINSTGQSLWTALVDEEQHDEIFAFRQVVSDAMVPLAYIITGPLVDHVLQPMMNLGGTLDGTQIGELLGYGAGRGGALALVIFGALGWIIIFFTRLNPNVRKIKLPDED